MRRIILVSMLLTLSLSAEKIYATFNVEAEQSANLAFSSSGIVSKMSADITNEVKEGDVIAQIQNADLKATLKIAQTALKFAKLDYDRQVKVKNLINKGQFDTFAFKYANAKAQVQYQQALLDKTLLKAPFDGVIYDKKIEVGDVVSGQQVTVVYKMQSRHERKLVLEFDEKYWNKVKVGDGFTYTLTGSDALHKGVITKVYPTIDNNTHKLKAEIIAKDIKVGLFGDGYISIKD